VNWFTRPIRLARARNDTLSVGRKMGLHGFEMCWIDPCYVADAGNVLDG
jgi:hypothetical protein